MRRPRLPSHMMAQPLPPPPHADTPPTTPTAAALRHHHLRRRRRHRRSSSPPPPRRPPICLSTTCRRSTSPSPPHPHGRLGSLVDDPQQLHQLLKLGHAAEALASARSGRAASATLGTPARMSPSRASMTTPSPICDTPPAPLFELSGGLDRTVRRIAIEGAASIRLDFDARPAASPGERSLCGARRRVAVRHAVRVRPRASRPHRPSPRGARRARAAGGRSSAYRHRAASSTSHPREARRGA